MSVPDLLDRLASIPGVQRSPDRPSALLISKPPGHVLEIDVAPGVLEWYATAYDAKGAVLWSDWMDYTGYNSTPYEGLEVRMCLDLSWFTEHLVRAEAFRARLESTLFFFAKTIPEVLLDGQWEELQMYRPEGLPA